MTAQLIDGKSVAARVRADVADRVTTLTQATGGSRGLATVLVGEDAASQVYVGSKRKACVAAGMVDHHKHLPAGVSQAELESVVDMLAADPGHVQKILAKRGFSARAQIAEWVAELGTGDDEATP